MNAQTEKIEVLENRVAVLEYQLAEASTLMEAMKALQVEQTQNTAKMQEMLEAFQSMKGGIRVLAWIGQLAKWVTSVSAGAAAVWIFWERLTGKH